MRILGIDPGLNITGYGLIETSPEGLIFKGAGYIKTRVCDGLPLRLTQIHDGLSRVCEKHGPEALVLEKLYAHYKHPVTASLLGHARGVICMIAEEKKIPFFEYAATRVKKSVAGNGHASKIQIQKLMEHSLGIKREALGPVDTTDAIALAITHANTLGNRRHT
jgi:crossover junction endodeoxyribonuclease RuvC